MRTTSLLLLVVVFTGGGIARAQGLAPIPPQASPSQDQSGGALYAAACASCHGIGGGGAPRAQVAFADPLPDFRDCQFAPREPDADWLAVIHDGGPARAFGRMMPAFAGAPTLAQMERVLAHVRGDRDRAQREAFWRVALGRSISQRNWGRSWSPMVELVAARELESGATTHAYRDTKSCQTCHMPVVAERVRVSNTLGEPRTDVSRHTFRGANFFMLKVLNRFRDELGVPTLPQELELAAQDTRAHLERESASLRIGRAERDGDRLVLELQVANRGRRTCGRSRRRRPAGSCATTRR